MDELLLSCVFPLVRFLFHTAKFQVNQNVTTEAMWELSVCTLVRKLVGLVVVERRRYFSSGIATQNGPSAEFAFLHNCSLSQSFGSHSKPKYASRMAHLNALQGNVFRTMCWVFSINVGGMPLFKFATLQFHITVILHITNISDSDICACVCLLPINCKYG